MAQNASADDAQTTTTVYFQDTSGQGLTARMSETANYRCKDSEDRDAYAAGVEEGDYIAVVYQTPSNGGSLLRSMGTVHSVERTGPSTDVRFEDDDGDAYLHLNASTGDYHFSDGTEETVPDGRRVEKIAWTPETNVQD